MYNLDQLRWCSSPSISAQGGADSAAILAERLHDEGFVIVKNVISPAAISLYRDRIEALSFTPPLDYVYHDQDLYSTIFNRDAAFLNLLDSTPMIEAAEAVLGDDCHVINQKAWRARPGHVAGGMHVDQLVAPMPDGFGQDPRYQQPMFIVSVLFYLSDIDEELCPTLVVPGSHRSGRAPRADEHSWAGHEASAVHCCAGDAVMFRSDLWHCGTRNRSADRSRYVIETIYGRRFMAQKFWPYLNFHLQENILSQATSRQRRLLGEHPVSNYG